MDADTLITFVLGQWTLQLSYPSKTNCQICLSLPESKMHLQLVQGTHLNFDIALECATITESKSQTLNHSPWISCSMFFLSPCEGTGILLSSIVCQMRGVASLYNDPSTDSDMQPASCIPRPCFRSYVIEVLMHT